MNIDPHWVFENHKEAARLIETLQRERDELRKLAEREHSLGLAREYIEHSLGLAREHIEHLEQDRDALITQVENWKEATAQYARNADLAANERLRGLASLLDSAREHTMELEQERDALQAELKKAVAALTDARFTRCDGPAGWRPPLGNPAGPLIDRIDSLEAERDALAAHVEFCHKVMAMVENGPSYLVARQYRALRMVRERKPDTSLARLKAQWKAQWQAEALEAAADELCNNLGGDVAFSDLIRFAAELRHQAEGGEP